MNYLRRTNGSTPQSLPANHKQQGPAQTPRRVSVPLLSALGLTDRSLVDVMGYRGTSLIRNTPLLGPDGRTIWGHMVVLVGVGAFSYEPGTPVNVPHMHPPHEKTSGPRWWSRLVPAGSGDGPRLVGKPFHSITHICSRETAWVGFLRVDGSTNGASPSSP